MLILDEHQHLGSKRITEKEEQQAHVCLKQVRGLNFHSKHELSQAARLAGINKKLVALEKAKEIAEKNALRSENQYYSSQQMDSDEDKKNKDEEPLDMLNLYVKELREPNY